MRMNFQKSIGTSKGYTFIIVDDRLCLLYQYDFGDENNPIMLVQEHQQVLIVAKRLIFGKIIDKSDVLCYTEGVNDYK